MRRPTALILVLLMLVALFLVSGCRASGTPEPSPNVPSSLGLVEEPKIYDGVEVDFTGEVIGEAMVRGDMAWLHINDDAYYVRNVEEGAELGGYNAGMAVWLPADNAAAIMHFGDYKHEGDIVTIVGTFNAACAEHGGDMDIHARELTVVKAGHVVVDQIRPEKVIVAVVLALLVVALYLLDRNWDHLRERFRG